MFGSPSALETCDLFQRYSPRQLIALATHATVLRPAVGLTLVTEGFRAKEFIVAVSGELEIASSGFARGRASSPATFGGPQISRQEPWPYTLTAAEDLEIVVLHQNAYLWARHHLTGWADLPDGWSGLRGAPTPT